MPIAPPDGMPVSGTPAGLAMLENAVGDGVITGEVSDATTLNPIAGAFVEIAGSGKTAETDAQGRFRFGGIPPGTYNIEASQLGYYSDMTVTTVIEGSPSDVRFGLKIKPTDDTANVFTLDEETVVGEYQGDSQGDLLIDLELSSSIASGISKDDFTRSGISDAGDAVSKIAGANIVGGRYAVVRGLGDRYSNTLVNGALISSADPTRKAVQLDLFPSDLLESISILKTFTPELPAEFAGGTVLIKTLQFPEERILKFEYGQKYNTNLDGDFFGSGTDLGYFGTVDNDFPSVIPSAPGTFESGPDRGVRTQADRDRQAEAIIQANALQSSSPLIPSKREAEMPESFSLTYGDTFKIFEDLELGVVLAGTSSNGDELRRDAVVGRRLNSGLDLVTGTGDDSLDRTQTENRFTSSAGYGLLGAFGLRYKERHSINLMGFQNHQAEDEVTQVRGIRDSNFAEFQEFAGPGTPSENPVFGATTAAFLALDNITPLRRTLTLTQASGNHKFGDEEHPFIVDWLISNSDAVEERPGTSSLFFTQLDFADPRIAAIPGADFRPSLGTVFTFGDIFGSNPPVTESFRETLETVEESTNRRIDLTFPLYDEGDDSFKIKIGGNQFDKSREVRGRFFTYNLTTGFADELATADGGQFGIDFLNSLNGLVDPNGDPLFNGIAGGRGSEFFIEENTTSGNTVRNVNAGTEVAAAYLQANLQIGRWEVIGGARYETEDRSFEVLANQNPAGTEIPLTTITNDYILPGITVNRTFGDDDEFLLTGAWSRTVARPTFFEFAPVRSVDQASGDITQGNPNLTDTLIDNFDLRWGWTPEPGTSFAISAFHKSLDSPIAQSISFNDRTFINGDKGRFQGLELELRKAFHGELVDHIELYLYRFASGVSRPGTNAFHHIRRAAELYFQPRSRMGR